MKPDMEQKLEQLAKAIGPRDSFVDDVMTRIKNSPVQHGKKTKPNIVFRRILMKNTFKFTAAAVILIAAALSLTVWDTAVPNVMASEVLSSAINAVQNVYAVHIKAQLRTLPQDNFSYINPKLDFVPIEMWAKHCQDGRERMRIDKPRRQLTMDGQTATMIINHNYVRQIKTSAYACFNSDWLSVLMNVDELLKSELKLAQKDEKHEISIYHERIDEMDTLIMRRCSEADVSKDDYLRNKFIQTAERTYYYYFDPETKSLLGMRLFINLDGEDVLIFEITEILYNAQIDDSHFTLEIPKDAVFTQNMYKAPEVLPDNEKYESMTQRQAAEAFFKACAEENWDEYLKFTTDSRVTDFWKHYLGGVEIISIGEPFTSNAYGGWYVPYEIKLKTGEIKKFNLALVKDRKTKRWIVDGGI